MIKITEAQLRELKACESGVQWFLNQKKKTLKTIIPALLKDNHFDYAKWLLSRLMTNPQKVLWAIKSAEAVLEIYEAKYPEDSRPRKAIEAAKGFLKGKVSANAAYAAADAAYAAAYAAANAAAYAAYAAYAAAYAANAAAYAANAAADAANAAAYAAADAAADAAYAAAYAAANAAAYAAANAAAYAARKKMDAKLCNEALKLLGEI